MFDYSTVKQHVIDYVGEFESDFDIDAVMDEIRDLCHETGLDYDDIESETIDEILQRHDVSGK